MAKDMVCHLCETSPEPEVGVMLVSDLTGSGQLPFAVGLNCMTDFLTGLLETFAQPEGITPPEPSELEEEDERDRFDGMESTDIGDILAEEEESEKVTRDAQMAVDIIDLALGVGAALGVTEDPTAILEPSGPSPVESSAPDTGNGSGKRPARPKAAATKTAR
jgi:hypothetical protein